MTYLRYHTRSQVHSKALPMVYVAGMIKRLDYLHYNIHLLKDLHKKVDYLRKEFKKNEFDTGKSNACVVPIYLPCSIYEALNLIIDLRENYNIFCPILVYPFVLKGQLLLRFIPTVLHTKEDINFTVKAMVDVRKNLLDKKYNVDRPDFFGEMEL